MKKKYCVTIQAVITKDVIVEAGDIDEAYDLAHNGFNPDLQEENERYEENTLNIEEIPC